MSLFDKSIFTLILLFNVLLAENTLFTVAVLDFEPRGITALEAGTLTDRFTSELNSTDAMRLVERGMMAEILEEQGFQQTGCTTDECAAEVRQLLGVQFMISGSIGKMGKSFTIDAKMFSVESGETVRTKSATHDGDISGLLTEMEILAVMKCAGRAWTARASRWLPGSTLRCCGTAGRCELLK